GPGADRRRVSVGGAARRVADLPRPWREDPLLVAEHGRRVLLRAEASTQAVALVLEVPQGAPAVLALGEPAEAARLVGALGTAVAGCAVATLARGTWQALAHRAEPLAHLTRAYLWDWLVIDPADVVVTTPAEVVRL